MLASESLPSRDDSVRCAASATFRPTPPRFKETVPGTVVCEPLTESDSFPEAACAVISTAAEPMITSFAGDWMVCKIKRI